MTERRIQETCPPDTPYGWLVAFAACATQFVTLGSINCFGVFFEPLKSEFGAGNAQLAGVVSLANFVAPIVGVSAGNLADRHGFTAIIFAAAICQCLSFLWSAVVHHFILLFATYGILAGFAAGCTISPSLGAVGQWFEEQRSTAMGIAFAGAGLGQVILPPLATYWLESNDWRYTFRCLSAFSVLVMISSVILRRRVIPDPSESTDSSISDILSTRGFKTLFTIGFCFSYGFFIPIVHIAMYAQTQGVTSIQCGYLLSLLGLFTTVGNIMWGTIADKTSNIQVFYWCHAGSGLVMCAWPFCTGFWSLALFTLVCGIFNGGCVTCYPALAAEIFPPDKLAGAISLIYTGFGIGSLVGPILTGYLVDVTGHYWQAAELGGAAFFGALIISALLPQSDSNFGSPKLMPMDNVPGYGSVN